MKIKDISNNLLKKIEPEDIDLLYEAIDKGNYKLVYEIHNKYDCIFIPEFGNKMHDDLKNKILSLDLESAKEEIKYIEEIYSSISNKMKNDTFTEIFEPVDSLDELKCIDHYFKNETSVDDSDNEDLAILFQALVILSRAGCGHVAGNISDLALKIYRDDYLSEINKDISKKELVRDEKSKAGKGNTSKYKECALQIAKDTWDVYPNATQEGMTEELFHYFRGKRTDNPAASTIRVWLSASKLNPKNDIKDRKFKLIIK
ncbi:TPA: hypothetical protein ON538_000302 [Morganella morganii]|nr:hypothetical protein [Morganella morganii]